MRRTKCLLYMIIVIVPATIFAKNGVNFTWSEFDERWDCVVGIAFGSTPIGTGVFITRQIVMTSANVVEEYINQPNEIKVYIINGAFNAASARNVILITSPFINSKTLILNNRKGSKYWVHHGFDDNNSPVHDIYTLLLDSNSEDKSKPLFKIKGRNDFVLTRAPIASKNKGDYKDGRYPFLAKLPFGNFTRSNKHYMFAGFGFVDREHIKSNNILEIELYGEEEVVVDCDEWIPREWGYFICILNVGHTVGVPSGAPLFNKGVLVGIGSFTLMKNHETIHVFTDLREYVYKMVVLIARKMFNRPANDNELWYWYLSAWYKKKELNLVKNLDYK